MTAPQDGNVSYSVKELLAKLDGKMDSIILALGSKAEKAELVDLTKRLTSLETHVELQDKVNAALRTQSATNFTRREKVIGVLLALIALAVQLYVQFGGH